MQVQNPIMFMTVKHRNLLSERPMLDQVHPDDYVCWTRMQSEAGQELSKILQRKENERAAGDGIFFWGVGNAPSKLIPAVSRLKLPVPIYFSIMKSKPKLVDYAPSSVVIWRRFIDAHGIERPLPSSALVTSRGNNGSGSVKTKHFALICQADEKLGLTYGLPFHHYMYRNAGQNGGQIGASQVTALLNRDNATPLATAHYEINLKAKLAGSYWVRLTDPLALSDAQIALYNRANETSASDWLELVSDLRQRSGSRVSATAQLGLF